MKKLLAFAIGAALSLSAVAAPIGLPEGPVYLKFNGNEQIAVGPGTTTFAGSNEINWGVFVISSIYKGVIGTPHQTINAGTGASNLIFSDGVTNNGQITGMFYGVTQQGTTPTLQDPFPATSGFIDLYWRDVATYGSTDNSASAPSVRCGFSCATGYTQGDFLVRLKFSSGVEAGQPNNYIQGTVIPGPTGTFEGFASSFAEVDLSKPGLWSDKLDSDWFNTTFGTRDFRFKNRYNDNASWDGAPGIRGAILDDPAQAVALPEPGALSLMGLTLAGMGAVLRRRQKKEKA
jgi:hypothetical protein